MDGFGLCLLVLGEETDCDSRSFGEFDVSEHDLLVEACIDDSGCRVSVLIVVINVIGIIVVIFAVIFAGLSPFPLTVAATISTRNDNALAVIAPFILAEVMRHVQTGEHTCRAKIGVHREEIFSEVRRSLQVGEQMS